MTFLDSVLSHWSLYRLSTVACKHSDLGTPHRLLGEGGMVTNDAPWGKEVTSLPSEPPREPHREPGSQRGMWGALPGSPQKVLHQYLFFCFLGPVSYSEIYLFQLSNIWHWEGLLQRLMIWFKFHFHCFEILGNNSFQLQILFRFVCSLLTLQVSFSPTKSTG